MAEGKVLPKGKTSKEWLKYADEKLQAFKNYHSERMFKVGPLGVGPLKNPPPLQDEYSKLLSQNELSARKMGMEFLRKERAEEGAKTMRKYSRGGKVRETGPAVVHRGEAVARTKTRKPGRSSSR